jgi:putative copper export protein/methionine-rich copper-binding protein CopC
VGAHSRSRSWRHRRSITRRALVLLIAVLLQLGLPLNAYAHQQLLRSTPAKGDHLSEVPRTLRLVFNEPVELEVSRLVLAGPSGNIALYPLRLHPDSSTVLLAEIAGPLEAGTYTVNWQVVGSDGHPVRGEFAFTVAPGAAGVESHTDVGPTAPGQSPPPAEHHPADVFPTSSGFDAESPLYSAIRWLTYVGLLVTIGVLAFRLLVLRLLERNRDVADDALVAPAAERARRVGVGAMGVLGAALLVRLYAQSYALHGSAQALEPSLIATMLVRTIWGWGWLLQLTGTIVVLGGLLAARNQNRIGWWITIPGVVALAFTPALSGHAVATPDVTVLAVSADGLHVLGAGGWLGGLLLALVAGLPVALRRPAGQRAQSVAALINAFSPTALFFAGLVVATGVFAAWVHLESVPALWQSPYGRTLLVKLAVLSLLFGTGAYNWLKVRPALGDEVAAHRLRRSAWLEVSVGIIVLAVTAVLVATPPPAEHGTPAETGQVRTSDPQ